MAGAGPVAKIEGACLAKVRTHLRSRSKIAVRIARFILKSPAAVAREAAQRFLSLGLTALTLEDPYFQIFATATVAGGDVVIGISHTGQTASVIEGIEQARRRGAATVALTNYPRSPLAAASDFALITAYREHRVNAAVSSSRIAQMCLIDSLYFILGSWRGKPAQVLAEEAEQRTRKILRIRSSQRIAKQKGIA